MVPLDRHPALGELVCFDLYAASRAVANLYRPLLAKLGVTYPQYLVLVALWERQPRTVKDLSDALSLDHGTLTPLLRRMEASGIVGRARSSHDERFVEISLTTKGEDLRARADEVHCVVGEALGLTAEETADLQDTLRTLTARVTPVGPRIRRR